MSVNLTLSVAYECYVQVLNTHSVEYQQIAQSVDLTRSVAGERGGTSAASVGVSFPHFFAVFFLREAFEQSSTRTRSRPWSL